MPIFNDLKAYAQHLYKSFDRQRWPAPEQFPLLNNFKGNKDWQGVIEALKSKEFSAQRRSWKQQTVDDILYHACIAGRLDVVQFVLTAPEVKIHAQVNKVHKHGVTALSEACFYGHLPVVKWLTTAPLVKADIKEHGPYALAAASSGGHLDIMRFLLTSPEVDFWRVPNIAQTLEPALVEACSTGQHEVVKWLTSSPELPFHASVHHDGDKAINTACMEGQLEVVKVLLGDPEVLKKQKQPFNLAPGLRKAIRRNYHDIIHYVVMEHGLEKTPDIERLLVESPYMAQLFDKRHLAQKLSYSLRANEVQDLPRKHKI